MTLLGKTLLFANLILSLIMAAWGLALYTGRIEWAPPPGKRSAILLAVHLAPTGAEFAAVQGATEAAARCAEFSKKAV